ncbi:MAG: 4Fe-4S binding protein [Deltaproteobacteria bacterium]|nr:4Fe-4S binding protein [Deltaproteobacteria bacterium]
MKTLLLYFSQTGNTEKVAKSIQDGIRDAEGLCDLIVLKEFDPALLAEYDLVGLGSPVFYYKEPFNVQDFIEGLPELNGQHWFVFCTHGNVIGNFFPSIIEKLKKKGALVIGFHNSYANITLPFYPRPSYTSGHPDLIDLEQARAFGRKIGKLSPQIKNQESELIDLSCPVSSEEWNQDSRMLTRETLEKILPKLSINPETCIQCRECEENCPVHGIDIEEDPPRIQTPCIYCWHCVNICPTLSIEADWEPLVRMAPANYSRYKKELDEVTERGEFRWLIDPELIDLNDPFYKQRQRETKTKK